MLIKIVIADDHAIFREGFKIVIQNSNVQVIGEASDGLELIDITSKTNPDLIFTDIKMPNMDGIEATKILHNRFPKIPIVALSMFSEEDMIFKIIEAGAKGFLSKSTNKQELIECINMIKDGNVYFNKLVSNALANFITSKSSNHIVSKPQIHLNEREKEIIRMICEECSSKEIALKLGYTTRTIENYRESIQQKTGAKNAAGVVLYAVKHGIYEPT
jgi:DNA-binding NarL/FixJ family response regulator